MRVAIVGCRHGELNLMYRKVLEANKTSSPVDLVLITGDFQAVRNASDLQSMSVPQKYLRFGDFKDYFKGTKKAPILTIFIGGNHEASNFMRELYYGGWVAPNIYYLGSAGVVRYGGLRIAGVSGIYSRANHHKGYYETLPITELREKKSVYHYRDLDICRLAQLMHGSIDIFASHDWPEGIWDFGDKSSFLKMKPFLKDEIERGQFGSPPLMKLMDKLQPRFWFSSHMHCRFESQYNRTFFLALDKCVNGRDFLDIIDVTPLAAPKELKLEYDPRWIAILRSTSHLVSTSMSPHGRVDSVTCENMESTNFDNLQIAELDSQLSIDEAVRKHYRDFLSTFELANHFNINYSMI